MGRSWKIGCAPNGHSARAAKHSCGAAPGRRPAHRRSAARPLRWDAAR
jgi:hypothetical protein